MLLALAYLAIPLGLPQPPGWSPRPDHASAVAQLYRSHSGLSGLQISADLLRTLNPALLLLATLAYGLLLWSRPLGVRLRSLATLCLPVALATLVMPPLYATDIFYYAMSGEVVARFGANPYLLTPADFPSSALLPFNYWTSITSPYGPLWTTVSAAAAWASSADPFLCTLLLKGVGLVSVAAAAAGIWWFLRSTRPEAARFGVMLFAANPFVWLVAVGDGHVDMLMAALMVLAAALLARGRDVGSLTCIGAATLVKYLTGPILPLFLLARVLSGRRLAALSLVAVFGAMVAVSFAPYWAGPATMRSLLEEGSRGYSAPPLLILQAIGDVLDIPSGVVDLVQNLVAAVMLATLGVWMLRGLRTVSRSDVVSEVRQWAYTLTAVAALLPRSHPWYLLTGMALLAAVHPTARRTTVVVYVATALWFFWRVGRI